MGSARRRGWTLLVLVGCASAREGNTPIDAPGGGDGCTVWYADIDEDGHGDMAASMLACGQPAKTVANSDDCDDKDRYRFPGASEVCDGADNDCNSATVETCPATCQPIKRPPPNNASTYLFCNSSVPWPNAQSMCASVESFQLVRINDAGENSWLRTQADTSFGNNNVHLAANDIAVEGFWQWDGSNEHFWQGGTAGMPIMGLYVAWAGGEPNNNNNEDCGAMRGDGMWYDGECTSAQRFVCER